MTDELWTIHEGEGPIVGTAIHAGHAMRDELKEQLAISESQRLREEDPYTAAAIIGLPIRIRVARSRFEVDLNRDEDDAVYEGPDQAWGLEIWDEANLDAEEKKHSLAIHRRYYSMLESLLNRIQAQYGDFVLLDVHSYNYRRNGPDSPQTNADAPEINIGTYSMDRKKWQHVVDPFMDCMREQTFRGRKLDVRENIAFQGKGEQTKFVHDHFPAHGCAIAIEFKKFFMDEWTGKPDYADLRAMKTLMENTVPVILSSLKNG